MCVKKGGEELKLNLQFENLKEYIDFLTNMKRTGEVGFREKDKIVIVHLSWKIEEYKKGGK